MAFRHIRHNDILSIIQRIDLEFFNNAGCYFAGGTAIAMAFGEKRLSFDIDFLANQEAMRQIRNRVVSDGLQSIFKNGIKVEKESRSGYSLKGIVKLIDSDSPPIKIEIVHEARISLTATSGLIKEDLTLMTIDKKTMIAQKILAICDRGLDVGFHSRDYWDFCVLAHNANSEEIKQAYDIACQSYTKSSVDNTICKTALLALKNKRKDFSYLQISDADQAELLASSDRIALVLGNSIPHLLEQKNEVNESLEENRQTLYAWFDAGLMNHPEYQEVYQNLVLTINEKERTSQFSTEPLAML